MAIVDAAIEAPLLSTQPCVNDRRHPDGTHQVRLDYATSHGPTHHILHFGTHDPLQEYSIYDLTRLVYSDAVRKPGEPLVLQPHQKHRDIGLTVSRACMRQSRHEDGIVYKGLRAERVTAIAFVAELDAITLASYPPTVQDRLNAARRRNGVVSGMLSMMIEGATGTQHIRALHMPVTPAEFASSPVVVAPSFVHKGRQALQSWVGLHLLTAGDGFIETTMTYEQFMDTHDSLFE